MSLDYLIVYKSKHPKIRIGSINDGGYVIADNLEYDCCISCGIADDINFEKEFLKKYPNVAIIAFDGTIDRLPEENSKIQFIKKNITSFESEKTTNMHYLFEKYNNIFLKMDIETYEFRFLDSLSMDQLKKIKQIVIEFHFPFSEPGFTHLDAPLPISIKTGVLKKLAETHTLIHLHGNNCCGITMYGISVVPNVFECTYVRKDVQDTSEYNEDPIPSHLDRPNVNAPDIDLNHYPFVIKNKK